MARYIIRRLIYSAIILIIAAIVIFVMLHLAPGDVALAVVGNAALHPANVAQVRHELGLDRPVLFQLITYFHNIVTGNFGSSLISGQSISTIIQEYAGNTLILALAAAVLTYVVAIPLGVLAAVHRNSIFDQAVMFLAVLGMGIPNFVLAIVLILFLAVNNHILPVSGSGDLKHLILPAFVLSAEAIAVIMRMMRSSMLEQLGQDYIRNLHAKGLPRWRIIWQHALRNALTPIISISAIQLRSFLGYTLIVEVIFRWPGLGFQLVDSILNRDYQVAEFLSLLLTAIVILFNTGADIAYAFADPRIRRRSGATR
ncbi:MAG TPA: ABC transporter permease [Chloroflexota bacterium]|jgi:ABC-type dipeptide/oligopeptide/nickel transport system permease component|nr:ABC transporter permease [Chloroflexota bacterium]